MRRLLLLFFATVVSCLGASVRDLGSGLGYLRIRDLDKETPASIESSTALVLDLRGTTGSRPEAMARLRAMVDLSARGELRLVLIDPTTAPSILTVLEKRGGSVLTLAAGESPGLKPDVPVATPLEADRQARDSLDSGRPLAEVLAAKVEKRRYDEAAMVRDHTNGVPLPDGPPTTIEPASPKPDPTHSASSPKDSPPKPPPPPFDAVLQRAVHVYQALQALKKV